MSLHPTPIACTCGLGTTCRVPHGFWIRARSRQNRCVCTAKCPSPWCEDVGRVDKGKLPAACCAHRMTIEQAKAERLAWKRERGYA